MFVTNSSPETSLHGLDLHLGADILEQKSFHGSLSQVESESGSYPFLTFCSQTEVIVLFPSSVRQGSFHLKDVPSVFKMSRKVFTIEISSISGRRRGWQEAEVTPPLEL